MVAAPGGEDGARVPTGLGAEQHLLQVAAAALLVDQRVGREVADVQHAEICHEVFERHPAHKYKCCLKLDITYFVIN